MGFTGMTEFTDQKHIYDFSQGKHFVVNIDFQFQGADGFDSIWVYTFEIYIQGSYFVLK